MLIHSVASTLIASLLILPAAQAQQPVSTVTVPAGTVVPLTLVNPIKNRSTRPGDTIRASVAFPITVGDQIAIPAGAYVEGVLGQPLPKVKHQPDPGVQVHFTRLIFANGYSTPLDATQASLIAPSRLAQPAALALVANINLFNYLNLNDLMEALPPPLWFETESWLTVPKAVEPVTPANPSSGPYLVLGIGLGVTAAIIILGLAFHHRVRDSDFIVHDAGWQFQMKLSTPLTLNPTLAGTSNSQK